MKTRRGSEGFVPISRILPQALREIGLLEETPGVHQPQFSSGVSKMKLNEFWVVTKPTRLSTLDDICFKSTPQTIGLQFAGGLYPEEVVGFYWCQCEAKTVAEKLLVGR